MDIQYINELLKEGNTTTEVRAILGIGEKKFQKEIKSMGYKYSQKEKQYIPIPKVDKDVQVIDNDSSMTPVTFDENTANNLLHLADNTDKILEVLKWFDNKDKEEAQIIEVIQEGISIDLPSDKIIRTTVKVNEDIWNDFKKFCEENKEYKQQDLLSMAIKNYINK